VIKNFKYESGKIANIHINNYKIFQDFDIDFLDTDNTPLPIIVIAGINGTGKTTLLDYIARRHRPEFIKAEVETKELQKVEQLIIKLVKRFIFKENYTPFNAYKKVSDLINNIFINMKLKISFNSLDEEEKVYFENKDNKVLSINDFSTGEKTLLSKVLSLYLKDIKNEIILIDEPELSLHPNWQNRVLDIYERFAIENNNQIIIATHSPHIIGSAKPESLRVLYFEDNKIKVMSNFTEGYGLEVNQVLTKIMNIDSLRTPNIDKLFSEIKNMIIKNNYKNKKFKETWKELEKYLGKSNIDLKLLKLEITRREKNV